MAKATGRPPKLTPEVQKAFCAQLVTGATFETAAHAMGLHHTTITLWMTKGRLGKKPYSDFVIAVQKARAEVVQRLLARAQQRVRSRKDGGEGADPLPLLSVLDRSYAPQVRLQITNELNGLLDRIEAAFGGEPELLERVLGAIAADEVLTSSVE